MKRDQRSDYGNRAVINMHAVIFPDGYIVVDKTEVGAWRAALGWPDSEAIESAKRRGAVCVQAQLRYQKPKRSETKHALDFVGKMNAARKAEAKGRP